MPTLGSDIIQSVVSSNTTVNLDPSTLTLEIYKDGTNVFPNRDFGTSTMGDQRRLHTLAGTFTGLRSYAVYIDDFASFPGLGDRVTLNGIGFDVVPERSALALFGLGAFSLILRRRK